MPFRFLPIWICSLKLLKIFMNLQCIQSARGWGCLRRLPNNSIKLSFTIPCFSLHCLVPYDSVLYLLILLLFTIWFRRRKIHWGWNVKALGLKYHLCNQPFIQQISVTELHNDCLYVYRLRLWYNQMTRKIFHCFHQFIWQTLRYTASVSWPHHHRR